MRGEGTAASPVSSTATTVPSPCVGYSLAMAKSPRILRLPHSPVPVLVVRDHGLHHCERRDGLLEELTVLGERLEVKGAEALDARARGGPGAEETCCPG